MQKIDQKLRKKIMLRVKTNQKYEKKIVKNAENRSKAMKIYEVLTCI